MFDRYFRQRERDREKRNEIIFVCASAPIEEILFVFAEKLMRSVLIRDQYCSSGIGEVCYDHEQQFKKKV
jgi:hypothetical protein